MQAAVCRAFGTPLTVEPVDLARPGPGEVGVRIAACAICHSDVMAMAGAWGGSLPAVFGHEAAGVVEEVGAGVARVREGDHVVVTLVRWCGACPACARGELPLCEASTDLEARSPLGAGDGTRIRQGLRTGAFAERVVVDASQVVPLPNSVPLDCAALLACGVMTGVGAVVNTAAMRPGSAAVTIGTGGVGLNCVQGAALCGAGVNIALDLAPEKLAAARAFGADHVIDPASADPREAVLALTGGRGADYAFVAVGSAAAVEQGFGLLRRGGTLVIVGMTAVGAKVSLEALDIADRGLRIIGSKMGAGRPQLDIPMLADWYLTGRLKLDQLITARFPLAEINLAVAGLRDAATLRNVVTF